METQPSNNLDTFKTLFIIKGILNLLFSLFFLIYAFIGFFIPAVEQNNSFEEMPFNFFAIFQIIGIVGFFISIAFGIMTIVAASYIGKRKHHTYIMVMAVLNCLTGILGILLGVFTIIELQKPHVKALFNQNK